MIEVRSLPTPRTQTHSVSVPVLLPMPLMPASSSASASALSTSSRISSHVAQTTSFVHSTRRSPWQHTSIASPPLPRLPPPTLASPLVSAPPPKAAPTAAPALLPSLPSSPTTMPQTTRDQFQLAHLLPSSHDPRLPQLVQAFFLVQTPCRARLQFDVGPTERHWSGTHRRLSSKYRRRSNLKLN